jgi:hypothetical protein
MATQHSIIKTYQSEDLTVEVPFRGDAFFNATVVADAFGKRPADWLRTDDTQAYILAVTRICVTEQNQLVIVKQGGNQQGTWFHPKIAVAFARWLNPDFAVWCDLQIDAILRGDVPILNRYRPSAAVVKALEAAAKMLGLAPSAKLGMVDKYLSRFEETVGLLPGYAIDAPVIGGIQGDSSEATATTLLKERGINIGSLTLNKLLEEDGFIVRLHRPSSKDPDVMKGFVNITEKGLEFGKNMTNPKNPRETQPHWYRNKFDELLERINLHQ